MPVSVGLMNRRTLYFSSVDDDLLESSDDSAFLQVLQFSCARINGVYRPLDLVEAYITEEDSASKVQRFHLIVVDLHLRLLADLQVDRCAEEYLHTPPIPWKQNRSYNFEMSLVTQCVKVRSSSCRSA